MPSTLSAASSSTPPALRARFVSRCLSLLDATFHSAHTDTNSSSPTSAAYTFQTDTQAMITTLTRADAERVAWVQWAPHKSMPVGPALEPAILFEGDLMPITASELLYSSSVLGASRKFRCAGYSDSFKWKKVTNGWQCFTSTSHNVVAELHQSSHVGTILDIFQHASSRHHPLERSSSSQTQSSSSASSSSSAVPSDSEHSVNSYEEGLQDTLLLTALLLLTPPHGPARPPHPEGSSPSSSPRMKHRLSLPKLNTKPSLSKLVHLHLTTTSSSLPTTTTSLSKKASSRSLGGKGSMKCPVVGILSGAWDSTTTFAPSSVPIAPPSNHRSSQPDDTDVLSPSTLHPPRRAFEADRINIPHPPHSSTLPCSVPMSRDQGHSSTSTSSQSTTTTYGELLPGTNSRSCAYAGTGAGAYPETELDESYYPPLSVEVA